MAAGVVLAQGHQVVPRGRRLERREVPDDRDNGDHPEHLGDALERRRPHLQRRRVAAAADEERRRCRHRDRGTGQGGRAVPTRVRGEYHSTITRGLCQLYGELSRACKGGEALLGYECMEAREGGGGSAVRHSGWKQPRPAGAACACVFERGTWGWGQQCHGGWGALPASVDETWQNRQSKHSTNPVSGLASKKNQRKE